MVRAEDVRLNERSLQTRPEGRRDQEIINAPTNVARAHARHWAPPTIVAGAGFKFAEGVEKTCLQNGRKPRSGLRRSPGNSKSRLRSAWLANSACLSHRYPLSCGKTRGLRIPSTSPRARIHATRWGSLRQHYLEQVQRVSSAPAPDSNSTFKRPALH
jgi:hypothetical protein